MSALGQKRTFATHKLMSAKCQLRTLRRDLVMSTSHPKADIRQRD